MKILLIGGTGVIGTSLLEYISDSNDVYVTTRHPQKYNNEITYITGDSLNKDFIVSILVKYKFDVIVDFMVYKTVDFQNIVKVFLKSCAQYIYVSSYRVFDSRNGETITEKTQLLLDTFSDIKFQSSDEYSIAKARQERILTNSGFKNWTIVRPSITFGLGRLQLFNLEAYHFVPRILQGLPIPIMNGCETVPCTLTSANDVGFLISCLIGLPGALSEDFNLTSNGSQTWLEVFNITSKLTGCEIVKISKEDYEEFGFNQYQLILDRMTPRVCNPNKIMSVIADCNFEFEIFENSYKKSLTKTLELYHNIKLPKFGRFQGVADRLTIKHSNVNKSISYFIGKSKLLNKIYINLTKNRYL